MPRDKLRIMYASNAPWCFSGYGVQGRSLLPRLHAWFGLQGGMLNAHGMPVYPVGLDAYGNDMYGAHAEHFKADLLITLIDAWVLKPDVWNLPEYTKWAPWYPVDHDPIPPQVAEVVKKSDYPMTYAKFGKAKSDEAGIENTYIAHGLETSMYRVMDPEAVDAFRHEVCEDAEWLGVMVSANKGWPSRKGFEETFEAFKRCLPLLPKKSILYVHADYTKATAGGDLAALVKAMGIQEHVRFPNRYKMWIGGYQSEYMALMYNAADVFLSPSKGEGFGIPIIEAQACGAPVIVTDFTSMPELVRWGRKVSSAQRQWTYMQSFQAMPSVTDIATGIMDLWNEKLSMKPAELEAKRQATAKAIHDEYSWDSLVAEQWQPFLRRVLDDINTE